MKRRNTRSSSSDIDKRSHDEKEDADDDVGHPTKIMKIEADVAQASNKRKPKRDIAAELQARINGRATSTSVPSTKRVANRPSESSEENSKAISGGAKVIPDSHISIGSDTVEVESVPTKAKTKRGRAAATQIAQELQDRINGTGAGDAAIGTTTVESGSSHGVVESTSSVRGKIKSAPERAVRVPKVSAVRVIDPTEQVVVPRDNLSELAHFTSKVHSDGIGSIEDKPRDEANASNIPHIRDGSSAEPKEEISQRTEEFSLRSRGINTTATTRKSSGASKAESKQNEYLASLQKRLSEDQLKAKDAVKPPLQQLIDEDEATTDASLQLQSNVNAYKVVSINRNLQVIRGVLLGMGFVGYLLGSLLLMLHSEIFTPPGSRIHEWGQFGLVSEKIENDELLDSSLRSRFWQLSSALSRFMGLYAIVLVVIGVIGIGSWLFVDNEGFYGPCVPYNEIVNTKILVHAPCNEIENSGKVEHFPRDDSPRVPGVFRLSDVEVEVEGSQNSIDPPSQSLPEYSKMELVVSKFWAILEFCSTHRRQLAIVGIFGVLGYIVWLMIPIVSRWLTTLERFGLTPTRLAVSLGVCIAGAMFRWKLHKRRSMEAFVVGLIFDEVLVILCESTGPNNSCPEQIIKTTVADIIQKRAKEELVARRNTLETNDDKHLNDWTSVGDDWIGYLAKDRNSIHTLWPMVANRVLTDGRVAKVQQAGVSTPNWRRVDLDYLSSAVTRAPPSSGYSRRESTGSVQGIRSQESDRQSSDSPDHHSSQLWERTADFSHERRSGHLSTPPNDVYNRDFYSAIGIAGNVSKTGIKYGNHGNSQGRDGLTVVDRLIAQREQRDQKARSGIFSKIPILNRFL